MPKPSDYDKNVFINCPFDDEYFLLLNPLLFTVVYFGYRPRIALESSDAGTARLDKITTLIQESKYAIHDLSRLQAKSANDYYRLNMPFELGIDYGLRKFHPDYIDKRSLILGSAPYEYMKAISDIKGFDIKHHNNDVETLIGCLRQWFSETVGLRDLNGVGKIYADFIQFNKDLLLKKMRKYHPAHTITEAEKFAKDEIDNLTIPEYIDEVRVR